MTTRRAAYRLSFVTGYVDLCPDCHAVLTREGEVAGDPREPMLTLEGWKRTCPAPIGTPCDICAGLEAYEAALNESRLPSFEAVADTQIGRCGGMGCLDGEECADCRHLFHDTTPTLKELEGEDCASY